MIPHLDPESKIIDLWTSSTGEIDFTPVEQGYLQSLLANPRIDAIWFGDYSLSLVYPEKGFHAVYPFDIDHFDVPKVDKTNTVSLFCPTGPKKNIINMLWGIAIARKENPEIELRTNIEGYDFILDKGAILGSHTMRFKWLEDYDYRQLIAACRVNLAVSHAETYNYQVAEALMCGTPSVISPTVPLPGYIVRNPNDANEIAKRILDAFGNDKFDPLRDLFIDLSRSANDRTYQILVERIG